MLQKWKTILTNWINCYFNESPTEEQTVSLESIIIIISHLRENLNLDESKSSVLEAHTIEEFIVEKYPEFKFENGTTEPTNEEDVYMVASLLLLFVCVNSKNVDIKNAMCSKLNVEDQEVIMKFSKYLMEYSSISYRNVQNAITEACGQDMACIETTNMQATVPETPPALRSLHSEVRRLQAALDAERFDRNYLQDELARTNLKLEKLLKDKQQYKLDMVALKSKISLCSCAQEVDSKTESGDENIGKLRRQLQQMEERLVEIQGQLDDVMYERDTYKTKLDEMKEERDKWLALSQQETTRVSELTSELELERQQVVTLKQLLTELRQHNQLNRLDASQCEIDDPDNSIRSMHNLSVCSEVCVNVVEVQLGEERAKVVSLKQLIQGLEEQLNDLKRKSEEEKQSLQKVVSERENDIFNLKHRINEEIEEKNNLKEQFSDQISRLNNEINELEQKLIDNMEQSRRVIEGRMQEIQTLQEEKLSLLQSLTNETTKLDNIITSLVSELDSEKSSKAILKEDYENNMMKLNEKVLNRNNELVELQNKISVAGERLEALHAELRNERQSKQDVIEKYNVELEQVKQQKTDIENRLLQKTKEVEDLSMQLIEMNRYKDELNKTFDECKQTIAGLHVNCKQLEETKAALENEIENSNLKVEEILKEMENMRNKFSEENNRLTQDIDERNATINTLQTQLQNEIEYKMKIQQELTLLEATRVSLLEDINGLKSELLKLKNEMQDKDKTIDGLDLYVQEEKNNNVKLKANCEKLNEKLKAAMNDVVIKENHIKQVQSTLQNKMHYYDDEIRKYNDSMTLEHKKLLSVIEEKGKIQIEQEYLTKEKNRLESILNEKNIELSQLRTECENLTEFVKENKLVIESLEEKLKQETSRRVEIGNAFDTETSRLMARLNETEKSMKKLKSKSNKNIEDKELEVKSLNIDLGKLQKTITSDRENIVTLKREKDALVSKLKEEVNYRNNLEKEYQNKCGNMSDVCAQLNMQIEKLKAEGADMLQTIKDKEKEICNLEAKVFMLDEQLKNEIQHRTQAIDILEKEKEQLHFVIEEDNSNHEVILKEKDTIIEQLEEELKVGSIQLAALQKDYEQTVFTFEKCKVNTQEVIEAKDNHIKELESSIEQLKQAIQANSDEMKIMEGQMIHQIEGLLKDVELYKGQLAEEKAIKDTLENEKSLLAEHKDLLERQVNTLIADINAVKTDQDALEKKNAILSQQIMEEKSVREVSEEQIKKLQLEKSNLELELAKEISIKKQLVDDKECLTQQLVEEKSAKELADQEKQIVLKAKEEFESKFSHDKDDYSKQIVKLLEDIALLNRELENERTAKQALTKEIERLMEESKEHDISKERWVEENNKLCVSNGTLTIDVEESKQNYVKLLEEHQKLVDEKERVEKMMNELQVAVDQIKNEKENVEKLLMNTREMNDRYASEIKEKQEKLMELDQHIAGLMKECQGKEECDTKCAAMLDTALKNILESIKKEHIQSDVLQKLISENIENKHYNDKCECLINIADTLVLELSLRKKAEQALEDENSSLVEMRDLVQQKEVMIHDLHKENKRLQDCVEENKIELSKTIDANAALEAKQRDMQKLQHENQSLQNELNDVKVQLEVKVHSLKEKLVDNEHLTEKLKKTYECQIDNLNVMVNKLTNYLKDKTAELDCVRRERDRLQAIVDENVQAIKTLEEEIKAEKQNQEKLITDFENERQVLKNMVTVTESVMEDQKIGLNKLLTEYTKGNEALQEEKNNLIMILEAEKKNADLKIQEKESLFESVFKEMSALKSDNDRLVTEKEMVEKEIAIMKERAMLKESQIQTLESQNKELETILDKCKNDIALIEESNNALIQKKDGLQGELIEKVEKLSKDIDGHNELCSKLQDEIKKKTEENTVLQQNITDLNDKLRDLNDQINELIKEKNEFEAQNQELMEKCRESEASCSKEIDDINKLTKENAHLLKIVDENKIVITNLEQLIKHELEQNQQLRDDNGNDRINLTNKCFLLQEYQNKAEKELDQRLKEIVALQEEVRDLKLKVVTLEDEIEKKTEIIANIAQEKDVVIGTMSKELRDEQMERERCKKELEKMEFEMERCKLKLERASCDGEALKLLRRENEALVKAVGHVETYPVVSYERASKHSSSGERDAHHNQKQLYQEQISVFQEKQKKEIIALEAELQAARNKLAESSKAYEEHIRGLTMELWDVGQKFLVKKDEAEWLRKKHRSGSLMSLQHVHSSGLVRPQEEPPPRPSDSHSLRSLPATNNANTNTATNTKKRDGRGLHMSDEEGEVFDNRFLKELSSTPRRPPSPRESGLRLSELRWRNSLCPPHLKSSYPAETQFAPVVDEEDIKCGRGPQRKEVGITAYKKPGPPTPSKQAGRLSATDCELRESLRVETDPQPSASRKTSTPSRIRALFKRHDTTDGTPRSKRLSIFRKK
ncbi:repetitive organellar protein-like isoform X2 [Plodia interpunctella]|uniref:repetitive organellar protein-like isoform X2 n=1 Tax=Plodia interpunctella TaxID=58824 RepID=UPI002368654B|nr:repetitive organellar protein-like isoform X2 [Plodia interpunctella]